MSIKPNNGLSPNTPITNSGARPQLGLSGANTAQTQSLNGKPADSEQKRSDASSEISEGQVNALKFSSPGRSISAEAAKASKTISNSSTVPPGGNLQKPFAPLDSSKMGLDGLAQMGKGLGTAFDALSKAMQQKKGGEDGAKDTGASQQQEPPPPPPPQVNA